MYTVDMNVVLLTLRTQMVDQRINFVVYVKVLSEPMKCLLSISCSKENGRQHGTKTRIFASAAPRLKIFTNIHFYPSNSYLP